MSDFNLADLLPFYLDETDENIAALNDALLRLELDPADAKALAEAFRMFHSIKGASVVMGFDGVNRLTHVLESLFDQLRTKKRELDRPVLDLTFRCLDELRDYHRELRGENRSDRDLAGLTSEVEVALSTPSTAPAPTPEPASSPRPAAAPPPAPASPSTAAQPPDADLTATVRVVVEFEPHLQLVDMKARLVAERLAGKGRITASDPPLERLEEFETLAAFTVWLAGVSDLEELRALADVDGVLQVLVELADEAGPGEEDAPVSAPEIADSEPADEPETAAATVQPDAPAPAPPARKARIVETIRVDSDRLDNLMNLAGELVINKARFIDVAKGLDEALRGADARSLAVETEERLDTIMRGLDRALGGVGVKAADGEVDRWAGQVRRLRDDFRAIRGELDRLRQGRERLKSLADAIHSLGRVADGLQKGVLETRMVPIGPLFERFRRVIRDLCLASGKEVVLRIDGEKTELDKRMIDELSDPLIHMVRNSVDHGLEPPDAREVAGKSRAGTVSLQASHRGNSVVITVGDDGRGIDCERIRGKIVSKGLVGRVEAAEMTDRELVPFIWHPGLSTAETVSEISGRGVGMDIVKERIGNLNGSVDVRSTPGQGTVFTIRLPLTLAIMSSLLVRIYDEVYALPLDHIDEIVEIRGDRIASVQGRPTIEIRGRFLTLATLGDLFRWGGGRHPSAVEAPRPGDGGHSFHVVIVQNGETTIGLVVDQLIGMQEVVLKSLERNYRPVAGLSGASILGDGRVSLILDVDALVDAATRPGGRA
ncbi:chemotaxis protein CheW [Planctomyces sp. SH-PL62]|uniref:chemotaxis protein CheW n=1 Tax=Planctomyces sp. SH-PL62 TaxID=1636152 RepID=UPI00078BE7D4|nr:chemotaxis protein CheA [Planctomyces sp. SH-PL62]AMV39063.1 Chemotaxis protein CheA [Planctomyces sp. SH-PL62]